MINYLLGIDGGGTKTEFLLTDLKKNEIRRIILGASNPVNAGTENTKSVLKQGIEAVCHNIPLQDISVFAGIAGCGSNSIKSDINKYLTSFGFGAVGCDSDAENVIYSALKGGDGVAVIMGTGIIAFGCFNGKRHRTGGWGYMIDKGGSGFSYGSDALNCAFSYIDGRDGSRLLLELIEKKINKALPDAIPEIYANGPAFAASLAPLVFEAYKSGDKYAEQIIEKNSEEAAKIITAAAGNEESTEIVISGGLCSQKEIIGPFISKYLRKNLKVRFCDEPQINGALYIAESLITR